MAAVHGARYRFFESVGKHYRERLDIDDVDLGGEVVVRGLVTLYGRAATGSR